MEIKCGQDFDLDLAAIRRAVAGKIVRKIRKKKGREESDIDYKMEACKEVDLCT